MIELKKISKIYGQAEAATVALDELSLSFPETGFVAIVGESGSGKTTLLNILGCLDKPTSGDFFLDGKKMSEVKGPAEAEFYATRIGMIFQEYNVFEELNVVDNILLSLETVTCSDRNIEKEIDDVLTLLGLEKYREKPVRDLSGGQKQRVAIARAIIKKPAYILADEPTGNLDSDNGALVFEKLREISKTTLVICVTHDKKLAETYCDRLVLLKDGKLESDMLVNKSVIEDKFNKNTAQAGSSLKKRVPFIKLNRYSGRILKKNKKKNIVNLCVLSVTFFLLLLFSNILFYNIGSVLKEYLKQYGEQGFLIKKHYKEYNKDITFSEELYSLAGNASDGGNIFIWGESYKYELIDEDYYEDYRDGSKAVIGGIRILKTDVFNSMFGTENPDRNEAVITKTLADKLGAVTGDKIAIWSAEYKVIDIIDDKQGAEPALMKNDPAFDFYNEFYSCYAYVSDFDRGHEEMMRVYSGFFNDSEYIYAKTAVNYKKDGDEEILYGDRPSNKNEIVVTSYLLEKLGMDENEAIGKSYKLADIYDKKFKHEFDHRLNLYEYVKTFTITGIAYDEESDVFLYKDLYDEVLEKYVLYRGNHIGVMTDNYDKAVDLLVENDCMVDDPFLSEANGMVYVRDDYEPFIILVLVVLAFLLCFVIILFISFFIKDNSRNIGILKSLGYDYKELKIMFVIKQIKNVVISEIIGFSLYYITILVANHVKRKTMVAKPFDYFKTNVRVSVIVIMLVLICSFIAAMIPLRKINKMTVIDAIKN